MMRTRSVLRNFKLVRPKYELSQAETLQWLGRAHAQVDPVRGEETFIRLFKRFGCSPHFISKRGTELEDSRETEIHFMEVFSPSQEPRQKEAEFRNQNQLIEARETWAFKPGLIRGPSGAGFSLRTRLYHQIASAQIEALFAEESAPPPHLVHVTCTGYTSPSPIQSLVSKKGWNQATRITHAYHMGCYASLPAVRIADGFRANSLERTEIVHTELCSLHLNLANHSPEQLVVQSLFADGHIRYSVENSQKAESDGLELYTVHEEILPNSTDLMTWSTSEWGMQMTLSKEVPSRISSAISSFLQRMVRAIDFSLSELVADAIFAIHPGGPRIIQQLQEELHLREEQVVHSKKVLYHYGNMSSATLPHIWQSLLEDSQVPASQWIVSLAFGPGLTAFGSVMRKR